MTKDNKPSGKAGRPKIGRARLIKMSQAQEAYAATQGDGNVSAGVRNCLDRCVKIDARKPIDLAKA